jgi:23S rRNA (uracil1939-C5)-methyltransferase
VVFLPETAPGDRVRAELETERRGLRRGRVLEILESGPGRREPPCPEAGDCGGCGWQHLSEEAQAEAIGALVDNALRRTGGFDLAGTELLPPRPASPPLAYRQRARFVLDLQASPPKLGFRRRRSHAVHAMASCPVLEPELDALRGALAGTLGELARLLPAVRQAELSLDLPAPGLATAALSIRDRVSRSALEACADWLAATAPGLAALECAGPAERIRRGPERVSWRREGRDLPASHVPGGFLQASRSGGELLVDRALAACGESLRGERLLELFSGSGNFTLPLAAAGAKVTAVEENPAAVAACRAALDEAGFDAELVAAPALRVLEGFVTERRRFDLVLLDPPRTGAKEEVRRLAALRPKRIVSVSCDAATFARDARLLRDCGYRLSSVEPLMLFPQTPHFEIVGLLEPS